MVTARRWRTCFKSFSRLCAPFVYVSHPKERWTTPCSYRSKKYSRALANTIRSARSCRGCAPSPPGSAKHYARGYAAHVSRSQPYPPMRSRTTKLPKGQQSNANLPKPQRARSVRFRRVIARCCEKRIGRTRAAGRRFGNASSGRFSACATQCGGSMASDTALFERSKRSYERARFGRALLGALPFVGIVGVAIVCGADRGAGACIGAIVVAMASFALWRGESLGRAVLPGVLFGVVPLSLALVAKATGHVCTGSTCVSLCVPACTAGGIVAGMGLYLAGRKAKQPWVFWGVGALLALATGSLGCSCVGAGGIVGLALGLSVSAVPMLRAKRAS